MRSWEKADRVLVVEAGFDWDDIGSWAVRLRIILKRTNMGNAANRAIHPRSIPATQHRFRGEKRNNDRATRSA